MPARNDSDLMFVYKIIRDLESIDHLCINPIHRIGLIHKCSIDYHYLKWGVQVNFSLNNCKQNTTSLSLLAGRIVVMATLHISLLASAVWHTHYFNVDRERS